MELISRSQILLRFPFLSFHARRKIHLFPKFIVDIKIKNYRVKTITLQDELTKVLALRKAVFQKEFAKKKVVLHGDGDFFDDYADHLAVFDEPTGRVLGSYRLIAPISEAHAYSGSEFNLKHFFQTPGKKLELSRACVAKEFRHGIIINLLWRGLAEYARQGQFDILFGLSSVPTMEVEKIATISKALEQRSSIMACSIEPWPYYQVPGFDEAYTNLNASTEYQLLIPPLFQTYLNAGARVCPLPALDRAFRCADWLMVLNMKELKSRFGRKFMQN